MNTGTTISGRPSMGSWMLYGLGAETENLPGYCVLISRGGGQDQPVAAPAMACRLCPAAFRACSCEKGDPVLYVKRPDGVDADRQRDVVDAVQQLNQLQNATVQDPEITTRISQYEMAFRIQMSVPELVDISKEPKGVLDLYGARNPAMARLPATACSPDVWPSVACGSSTLSPRTGIITAASRVPCKIPLRSSIKASRR